MRFRDKDMVITKKVVNQHPFGIQLECNLERVTYISKSKVSYLTS